VVIDRDRIEERNLSTQPYYKSDVGAYKAKILSNTLYRALGVTVDGRSKELTTANAAQLLRDTSLVIDTFDNSVARQAVKDYCQKAQLPCLHVGLASDYSELIWNEIYRVPSPVNDDVCDYPLARNLVILTVAVACEVIINFVASAQQQSFTVTLGDFAIRPFEL
jgi:molybdopterin/thiamine biosynthesis adenylyltransferase